MSEYRRIEDYWRNLSPPPDEPVPQEVVRLPSSSGAGEACAYARAFEPVGEKVVSQAKAGRSEAAINIAMLLLQDRYFDYWREVPGEHRAQGGHRCVSEVYEELYGQLRELQLQLVPPRFSDAPPAVAEPEEEGPRFFGTQKEDYRRGGILPPLGEDDDGE